MTASWTIRAPRTAGILASAALALAVAACGSSHKAAPKHANADGATQRPALPWDPGPAPELRNAPATAAIALVGGTVWTAAGQIIPNGLVVARNGVLEYVGPGSDAAIPDDAQVFDVRGRHVTPGLIDTHSHMGVYAVPSVEATDDGNEATSPNTAEVWAGDSFWPQDPALGRALAAGVTTIQVLPGSANLFGGRGVILKLRPALGVTDMRFPGAPDTLKMACGENPKRVYGGKGNAPSTRMGNVAGYRAAFQKAVEYRRRWREWQRKHAEWSQKRANARAASAKAQTKPPAERGKANDRKGGKTANEDEATDEPSPPDRDFALDTLAGVLDGKVLVQMHCYRADEMLRMMELAHDFGFRIQAFHHAVEAYKIRNALAWEGVGVNTWPDWWGFKLEAFDAIPENLALLTRAGVHAVLHSDSEMLTQRLAQEAGKAQAFGRRSGVEVSDNEALRWVTAEPAWVLGIADKTGRLERGLMADVVVWSGEPLSVYSHPELVFIDGSIAYNRAKNPRGVQSDFELGWEDAP